MQAFLLNCQVLNEYLCVEGALFIGIFSTGLELKSWAFSPTHVEKQQNVDFIFLSKHHVCGTRVCVWGAWQLAERKCSMSHAFGACEAHVGCMTLGEYFNLFHCFSSVFLL